MFRKGFASLVVAAAASAVLLMGPASAQVRTAALEGAVAARTAAINENRMALVIGNSNYLNSKRLNNAGNDAQAVSQLLNTAGFEVVLAFDLDRDVMKQTVEEFAARIKAKGPNTVVMIYYAGHGLQVDGENYLVPVDAQFQRETDLVENGVKLADVMGALEAVPSKMRIVILDACRNNPFDASGDAGGRGLAIVDAPTGSIVAYSTAPGTEASDGNGRHSPYAAAFMRTVKQPNMPIEQVFKRVRMLVHESTDSKQTPWESSSLTSDFAFFTGEIDGGGAVPAPAAAPVKLSLADLRAQPARVAYEAVIAEDSVEYYEEFVRLYPADPLCDRIRRLLSRRQQMIAWHNVTHRNSPDAYASFVSRFGDSDLVRAARRLQDRPRRVNIAFPRRDESRFGNGSRPIPFPNGNTGINGSGRPNANNSGGRPIPFPNGNTGINGSGRPNANNAGRPVIPFPNGNTGINGSGRPGPVAGAPQNGGINPNAGRPIITRPQIGSQGINPNVGRPQIVNRPKIDNQGINPNAGRPVIQPQRPAFQARPSFQPRVASGGNRFANDGDGRFGGRR